MPASGRGQLRQHRREHRLRPVRERPRRAAGHALDVGGHRWVRAGGDSRHVVEETYPPMVRYSLTDLGETLVAPLQAVHRWAEGHIDLIAAARGEHDARGWCVSLRPRHRRRPAGT
jgi:hypothetical protein